MLRYAVFLIFIILGFILSHHRKLYPIVSLVYSIALFYYTFLSRMELATTTEAVVATSTPVQQHWWVNTAYEIFRMKTGSYREAFILNMIEAAKKAGTEKFGKAWAAKCRMPLHDGDTDKEDDAAYADSFFINSNNRRKPKIYDEEGKPTEDSTVVYSGCYGSVMLEFYPYQKKTNQGISASLLGFMKTNDGEPLGGGSIDVAAGFGIENSDDDFLS